MNSIVLVTYLAGAIIGSATFKDMDSCIEARDRVLLQAMADLNAVCVYKEVKPDRSKEMFKIFGDMIKELGELETK